MGNLRARERRVALLQSNYLPWKGYFELIHSVDEFIFFDDVQFTKNDFRNRNRIKTPRGVEWITIPCGSRISRLIREVEITSSKWRRGHWEKIRQSYRKAPYFKLYKDFFESYYSENTSTNLSEINQFLIRSICEDFLGFRTKLTDCSSYKVKESQGSERVLEFVLAAGGTTYVSGPSARNYLDINAFRTAGITVEFFDYEGYEEYEQLYPPFEHTVSIVDLLFMCGSESPKYVVKAGKPTCNSSGC